MNHTGTIAFGSFTALPGSFFRFRLLATWGAARMTIEADPDAAPFYRHLGARDIGLAPSGSIAGRVLPKLALDL
jgi:hypothetical protein